LEDHLRSVPKCRKRVPKRGVAGKARAASRYVQPNYEADGDTLIIAGDHLFTHKRRCKKLALASPRITASSP